MNALSLSHVRLFETPWNSPGQNTGVGSLSLHQGIFPTQGLNLGLSHCRWIIYLLRQKGNLGILEWVAYPFSNGSSQPRNQTRVSCAAGRFFSNWAIRESQFILRYNLHIIYPTIWSTELKELWQIRRHTMLTTMQSRTLLSPWHKTGKTQSMWSWLLGPGVCYSISTHLNHLHIFGNVNKK